MQQTRMRATPTAFLRLLERDGLEGRFGLLAFALRAAAAALTFLSFAEPERLSASDLYTTRGFFQELSALERHWKGGGHGIEEALESSSGRVSEAVLQTEDAAQVQCVFHPLHAVADLQKEGEAAAPRLFFERIRCCCVVAARSVAGGGLVVSPKAASLRGALFSNPPQVAGFRSSRPPHEHPPAAAVKRPERRAASQDTDTTRGGD